MKTRDELKRMSKNELIRLFLDAQEESATKLPWPAIPAGQEMVIVSRTEWRRVLESTADEFSIAFSWGQQFNRAKAEIETMVTNAFVAVAAGGHGDALRETLRGYDGHLLNALNQLDTLCKYPPGGITLGTIGERVQDLGKLVLTVHPAIKSCVYGCDGGAALRRIALEQGYEHLKTLIEALEADLEKIGAPSKPGRAYFIRTATQIADRFYPKPQRRNWSDVEKQTLAVLESEDTTEAQQARDYWRERVGGLSDSYRREELRQIVKSG
jgi:hypothetical protein